MYITFSACDDEKNSSNKKKNTKMINQKTPQIMTTTVSKTGKARNHNNTGRPNMPNESCEPWPLQPIACTTVIKKRVPLLGIPFIVS